MRYWVVLVALALAVFGAWWLVQLLALGQPHADMRGWLPGQACTTVPAWSDAPYTCPGGR